MNMTASLMDAAPARVGKLPLVERLQALLGYSQFGNIDKLPHSLRDTIQSDMERSGILSGRRLYIFNKIPYHSLLRPLTPEEKKKNFQDRLRMYEFIMMKLREYEMQFLRTAAKLAALDDALDKAINYLKNLEAGHKGKSPHDLSVSKRARKERKDLEDFQADFVEGAQRTLHSDPAPSQEQLEEIEERIDTKVNSSPLLRTSFKDSLNNARKGLKSFYSAIAGTFLSSRSDDHHDDPDEFVEDLRPPPPSRDSSRFEADDEESENSFKAYLKKKAEKVANDSDADNIPPNAAKPAELEPSLDGGDD